MAFGKMWEIGKTKGTIIVPFVFLHYKHPYKNEKQMVEILYLLFCPNKRANISYFGDQNEIVIKERSHLLSHLINWIQHFLSHLISSIQNILSQLISLIQSDHTSGIAWFDSLNSSSNTLTPMQPNHIHATRVQ